MCLAWTATPRLPFAASSATAQLTSHDDAIRDTANLLFNKSFRGDLPSTACLEAIDPSRGYLRSTHSTPYGIAKGISALL